MVKYNNILERLKAAGYSSTRIRKEKILSQSTLTKIRNNEPVNVSTLDQIASLIGCDISDLIRRI